MQRQKRILVSWYTNPLYIPPFVLSGDQITVGPQLRPEQPQLMYACFTPAGAYDLKSVLEAHRLPTQFDAIVVWSDSTQTNLPLNLGAFDCPKVLCIGDTHHMARPLHKMLTYAIGARYDFVLSSHNRHHLHWFAEAGFARVAWLPGLKVQHLPRPFQTARKPRLSFIGNFGDTHPRRTRILRELERQGLPVTAASTMHKGVAADMYADSLASFNASLNGDFNLRVFEILSAAGCLMTDRLAPQAGLDLLLKEGTDFIGYDSAEECADQTRFLLSHPDIALGIAKAGHRAFLTSMLPQQRAAQLLSWVFEGRLDNLFRIDVPPRNLSGQASINDRVRVYEELQELHRLHDSPQVLFLNDVPDIYLFDASDLKHLKMFAANVSGLNAPPKPPEIARHCTSVSRAQMEATEWDAVIVKGSTEIPPSIRHRHAVRTDQPILL